MAANKYLQQATGAFRPIQASDLSTALQSFTATSGVNSTSTTTNFTLVPGCTLTQGSSGVWLVTATTIFYGGAGASIWWAQITDATTTVSSAVNIATAISQTSAGGYDTIALSGIVTSPTSQITLRYTPNLPSAGLVYTAASTSVGYGSSITAVRIG